MAVILCILGLWRFSHGSVLYSKGRKYKMLPAEGRIQWENLFIIYPSASCCRKEITGVGQKAFLGDWCRFWRVTNILDLLSNPICVLYPGCYWKHTAWLKIELTQSKLNMKHHLMLQGCISCGVFRGFSPIWLVFAHSCPPSRKLSR